MRKTDWIKAAFCIAMVSCAIPLEISAMAQEAPVEVAAAAVGAEQADEPQDNGDELAAGKTEVLVETADEAEDVVVFQAMAPNAQIGDPKLLWLSRHLTVRKALVRRCGELSEQTSRDLATLNEEWLQQQLAAPADAANGLLVGIARFLGNGNVNVGRRNPQVDDAKTVRMLRTKIDETIREKLPDEIGARFDAELQKQREFEAEAAAHVLVSLLDKHAFLSEEQAAELTEALAKWADGKMLYLPFYVQNDSYLPQIPHSVLAKVLNAEQSTTISALNKYDYDTFQWELQMIEHEPPIVIKDK